MTVDLAPPLQPPFERALRFGRFSLDPARKLLRDDSGRVVRLGGRALDLLIALVERAGEVVSHDDLFARVWPHTVVEQSSLRVHLSSLRKALGDGVGELRYIASLPGRGYSFVMEVAADAADVDAEVADIAVLDIPPPLRAAATTALPPRPLPPRLSGIIGREQVLAVLSAKLQKHRLVTLVGPGGIGKTTVAIALAEEIGKRHADGALFVDLAPLGDASLVSAALAAMLGIAVPAQSPWPTLDAALATRDLLIVLDNCEHLIVGAATLAERVLRAAPRVRILATSREPLEAESEAIHRLASLEVPPAGRALSVDDALAFPALRLFVERATASADDFVLSPDNLALIVRLCRHLDGLPLAIELAAARVGSLGIDALARRLDDVFRLLRRGRRTVLPRHQTLAALLDWSHGLLDEDARRVMHRLSVFRSSFTLDDAADLANCERIDRARVVSCLLDLVSRSLVELEPGDAPRYRLLFVARLYAQEKLALDGESQQFGRRHAACFRDLLAHANIELDKGGITAPCWRTRHAATVTDIRAALDWAAGPGGDRQLGAELVVESGRLLLELGLNDEILPRALDALMALRAEGTVAPQLELRLLGLLCMVNGQSLGDCEVPPEMSTQLDELAQRIGTPAQRQAALLALSIEAFGNGFYPRVLALSTRLQSLQPDPDDPLHVTAALHGRRFGALSKHYLGDHRGAWADCEWVAERAGATLRGNPHMHMPLKATMGIQQARILWLEGFADRALERAFDAVAWSEGVHPFAISQALSLAVVPILLWRGDDERAATFLAQLVEHDQVHLQSFWLAWSHGYCRVLALRGHDVEALRRRLGPDRIRMNAMQSDMLGTQIAQLVGPEQLARVEAGTVGWCAPEILRVHGERLRSVPKAPAEAVLLRALALARRQGARAWELRAASSVASLWHSTGRGQEARALLAAVVAGFSEGRDDADMRRAQSLLCAWSAVS